MKGKEALLDDICQRAADYTRLSPSQRFVSGFLAGCFITFGAALSIFLSDGVVTSGPYRLLQGLGFVAGFSMAILSGAAMYTEVNVTFAVMEWFHYRSKRFICWRNMAIWLSVPLFNFIGATTVAFLLYATDTFDDVSEQNLASVVAKKLSKKDQGAGGWFQVALSAVLGNWMVGMAVITSASALSLSSKLLGLFFPVLTFVSLGLQHSPANMGYLMLSVFYDIEDLGTVLAHNLLPAAFGNFFGGALMVGTLFHFLHHSRKEKPPISSSSSEEDYSE